MSCQKVSQIETFWVYFFKMDIDELFLISNGRAFPSVGAVTEKD